MGIKYDKPMISLNKDYTLVAIIYFYDNFWKYR